MEDLCEQVVIVADGRRVASGAVADLRSTSPTRRLRVRGRLRWSGGGMAGRIYRYSLLRTGSRVTWAEAWRNRGHGILQ